MVSLLPVLHRCKRHDNFGAAVSRYDACPFLLVLQIAHAQGQTHTHNSHAFKICHEWNEHGTDGNFGSTASSHLFISHSCAPKKLQCDRFNIQSHVSVPSLILVSSCINEVLSARWAIFSRFLARCASNGFLTRLEQMCCPFVCHSPG